MTLKFRVLWHSALSSLTNDLLNDGGILEMYNRVVYMAIETSFRLLFTQKQTTRFFYLKAQRLLQVILMNKGVWRPELEMNGWDHGGRPDHLPQKDDDGQDVEPDTF